MLSNKIIGATAAKESLYVEDVASVYLYTGNGSTQTITNNVDLSGEGGLVWIKSRSAATAHQLFDTDRGATKELISNSTAAEATDSDTLTAFNADGFSLGADSNTNTNAATYCSWSFRKAPKFFDVVTYTGTGSARTVSHNLGSAPGMMIIKSSSNSGDWYVYQRTLGTDGWMMLNLTTPKYTDTTIWNNTAPTSTVFSVGSNDTNRSGYVYVAYLFAHDAGGFGAAGTDNIISCGSYTGNNTSLQSINLGYEPQLVLIKSASINSTEWAMLDNMRGVATDGVDAVLNPNTNGAEASPFDRVDFTATGFNLKTSSAIYNETGTYIYIAIRRPMKTPTSGTEVFSLATRTGTGSTASITGLSATPDVLLCSSRDGWSSPVFDDRLRGFSQTLVTVSSSAEGSASDNLLSMWNNQITFGADSSQGYMNWSSKPYVNYLFSRRPGFFDQVCYTGTGSNTTQAHNLGAVPELMIVKSRSLSAGWFVYSAALGANSVLELQRNIASANEGSFAWNSTEPTSSVFTVGSSSGFVNNSGATYVAYLFATLAGISKIGSYTGTGSTQTINCGFTAGARFVLIKRTDSTGDWYVWDTARGIVSGNDPYLLLNSTAAEVTNTDYIDPVNSGFELSSTAPAAINANGGSFIFLAVS